MIHNSEMHNSDPALMRLRAVSFFRGERKIFDDVTLDIPKGKIVGILGSSGCGKTTFLKLMSGQLPPSSGTVFYEDTDVHALNEIELYQLRKKMGMLFQSGALFSDMSVYENVAFPLREHTTLPEPIIRSLVLLKLQSVGLRGASELLPSELSGGMTRRIALARAIVLDPELILYDEPFAGQDPISMGVLLQLIKALNTNMGITSVIVSHDVQELMSIADYIYALADGAIVASGTPDAIRKLNHPWVQQFVMGNSDGAVQFDYPAPEFTDQLNPHE